MSRNFVDLERELLADLERRTGKDLAHWMAAIDAAGLAGKNAVIDWLRPQGFTFANASWLERIHNNGGRPIYLDQPAPLPRPAAPDRSRPQPKAPLPAAQAQAGEPPALAAAPAPAARAPDAVREALTRGKAYRPLAEHLLREIERALPGLGCSVEGELVVLARPRVLAAIHATPREVRLGLDLGDRAFDAVAGRTRLSSADPRLTHMVVLTDARQVAPPLLDLVRQSDLRANPPPPGG